MKYNLQFFGGRGASGIGGIGGAEITINGRTATYYFYKTSDGVEYYQRDLASVPEEIPGGMTARQFINRAKENGAEVSIISEAERNRREAKRNKERENRPDYELGYGMKDNRAYRRTARRNRLASRISKRR